MQELGPHASRLYAVLRQLIHSGDFSPITGLPSDTELAVTYQTTPSVVAQAITVLAAEGLLARQIDGTTTVRSSVPYGVLVVDADDETASLVREQLETMGYRYRVLSTGRAAEALALLEADANLKLVLVDAALHGEPDGVDLVRAARRGWPDLPLAARARSAADLAPLIGTPDCPFLLLAVPLDGAAVKQLLRLVLRGGTT